MASVPTMASVPASRVLNSWKEIATYLGRGVRTVQRYERDAHLPVRRLPGKPRGTVIAFPKDLDDWLRLVSRADTNGATGHTFRAQFALDTHQESIRRLEKSLASLREQIVEGQRICSHRQWFGRD